MPGRRRWPRRGSIPIDFYESAADRLEQARQAAEDFGDRSPRQRLPTPPRLGLVFGLFALILITTVVQSGRDRPPELAADCANSRLVLSTASVRQGNPVRWTATGPEDGTVLLGIDIARVTRTSDGALKGQPVSGKSIEQTQRAAKEQRLTGCRGSGVFGVVVPPGKHTVTLFRLSGSGGSPAASAPLEVTSRD